MKQLKDEEYEEKDNYAARMYDNRTCRIVCE